MIYFEFKGCNYRTDGTATVIERQTYTKPYFWYEAERTLQLTKAAYKAIARYEDNR